MRDSDIRPLLCRRLRAAHPDALVLDEVGLVHGHVRVDVAALSSDCFHGYEVKADADSLRRLPTQVWRYGEALDACTLVTGPRHLDGALALLPPWWGVVVATGEDFHQGRAALPNPSPSPVYTTMLLWRDEVLALLESRDAARGFRKSCRLTLYHRLVEVVPAAELRGLVRRTVLARGDWRTP